MIIIAIVVRVDRQSLLVRNEENRQEVLTFFGNANSFSVNDRIRITFNGQMTFSIPPQITATAIHRLDPVSQSRPSEMRAVVLQRGRNFLVVRNTQNRQEIRVEYPHAHHFCVGQRIDVRYDTITMGNPNRVTAVDIFPVC